MKKRFFLLFVMVGLLVTLASCAASKKYVKLTLSADYYEVYKGQTIEILPTVNKGSSVGDVTIEYSSYDETVATYADGKLQGVEYGETIIKVVYAGNATICDVAKVVVVEHDLAAEVGVNESPLSLYENASAQIEYTDAKEAIYTFESSNNDVATVDANGVVTAAAAGATHNDGQAVITVTASDLYGVVEDVVFTVEVTVKEAHFAIALDLNKGAIEGEYATEYDVLALPHELPTPTRAGYDFAGWLDENGETVYAVPEGSEGAVSYTAQWVEKTYKVEYELNGGTNAEANPDEYKADAEITLAEPTKEGHTFAGWYINDALVEELPTDSYKDLVVVAKWTINQYTIKFVVDGVETVMTQDYATAVVAPTKLEKVGHTFDKWDVDVPSTMPVLEETLVITALWTVNKYTITYNDYDATTNTNDTEFTFGVGYTLKPAVKIGHTFDGWFDNAKFEGEPVTEIAKDVVKNVTLYAKFTPVVYTVTFDAAGGEEVETIEFTILTETFELEPATRLGYTFLGWYDSNDVLVEEIVSGTIENVELTAKWEIITYVLNFTENGGNNIPNLKFTVEDETVVFDKGEYAVAREGYTFLGWRIGSSELIKEFNPAEQIAAGYKSGSFARAEWAINQYTITFVADGKEEKLTQDYASDVKAPADPEKEGHTFAGWDKEIPTTMPAEDLVITAKFNVNNYVVKLFGTLNIAQPYGSDYVVRGTVDPVKEGHTFVGWDIYKEGEEGDGVADELPLTVPAYNTIAMPVFEVNYYGIIFGTFTIKQPYGADYCLLGTTEPTKEGHTFVGWDIAKVEEEFDGIADEIPATVPAYDTKVQAVWDADTYNITYVDSLGATNAAEFPATYDFGVGVKLVDGKKPGYNFLGWFDAENNKVVEVSATDTEDKEFTAKWELATSVLTFDANGGKEVEAVEFNLDTVGYKLPETTKEGYKFVGWFEGEKAVTEISGRPESFKVVAKWEANEYAISYDLAGGQLPEGKTNPDKYLSDAKVELVAPEKEGYEFTGWLVDGKEMTEFPSNAYADIKVVATWKVLTYVVTFVVDGAKEEVEVEFGAEIEAIANPAKDYYDFKGWNPALPETMPAKNLEVVATWAATEYKIIYKAPETATNPNPTTYTVESETIVLADLVAEHYEFKGWFADEACTKELKEIAKGSHGDITVYCSIVAAKYQIVYNLPVNGYFYVQGNKVANVTEYEHAQNVLLETPTIPGYKFLGWYDNEALEGEAVTEIKVGSYGKKEFFAKYEAHNYTLTFVVAPVAGLPTSDKGAMYAIEGVVAPAVINYTIESAEIPFADLSADGYEFAGWFYNYQGELVKLEGNFLPAKQYGNLTFYALWNVAK